jgi:hypothetical protein
MYERKTHLLPANQNEWTALPSQIVAQNECAAKLEKRP